MSQIIDAETRSDRVPHESEFNSVLSVQGLVKSYRKDKLEVPVLRGVDFEVESSCLTSLVGRSGSGKSTLMHLMATLDQPDAGKVIYNGSRIDNAPTRERDFYRNHEVGMIFQFYHLLPELSALENVMVPTMISRSFWSFMSLKKTARDRASQLLQLVGLDHRMHHKPSEMSGGEMQRAAIARALMNDPKVLLADEPTGNLDGQTGKGIIELLKKLNHENGLTIVMITHDDSVAEQADRLVRLENGLIVDDDEHYRLAG